MNGRTTLLTCTLVLSAVSVAKCRHMRHQRLRRHQSCASVLPHRSSATVYITCLCSFPITIGGTLLSLVVYGCISPNRHMAVVHTNSFCLTKCFTTRLVRHIASMEFSNFADAMVCDDISIIMQHLPHLTTFAGSINIESRPKFPIMLAPTITKLVLRLVVVNGHVQSSEPGGELIASIGSLSALTHLSLYHLGPINLSPLLRLEHLRTFSIHPRWLLAAVSEVEGTVSMLNTIGQMALLTTLTIEDPAGGVPAQFLHLLDLPCVTKFSLARLHLSSKNLLTLHRAMPQLEEIHSFNQYPLYLPGCARFTNLRSITFTAMPIYDDSLTDDLLNVCPRLTHIRIQNLTWLTADEWSRIAIGIPTLTSLHFESMPAGFFPSVPIPNLRHIWIDDCSISPADCANLTQQNGVEHLQIELRSTATSHQFIKLRALLRKRVHLPICT